MERFRLPVVVSILLAIVLFAFDAFPKGPSDIALMFKDISGRLDRIESLVKDLSARLPAQTTSRTDLEKGQEAYLRGRAAEELNDCARALPDLTKAVELDPANDSAFLHRGYCNLKLNNVAEALGDTERSIRLQPNNARAYEFRSRIHRMLNQPGFALEDLEQSVQRDPSFSSYMVAAAIAEDLPDYPKAIDFYSKAQLLDPGSATVYVKRAQAYKMNHREDEGMADCEHALNISQGLAEAYYCRADSYLRKGQPANAVSDLNEAIRRKPDFPGAQSLLSTAQQMMVVNNTVAEMSRRAAEDQKRQAEAQAAPTQTQAPVSPIPSPSQPATKPEAATPSPDSSTLQARSKEARTLADAGRTALQNGQIEMSVQLLSQAIQLDPSDAKTFNARGYAYLRQKKQYRQAIEDFNQALALKPNYTNASSNRAVALRLSAGTQTARSSKSSNN